MSDAARQARRRLDLTLKQFEIERTKADHGRGYQPEVIEAARDLLNVLEREDKPVRRGW